MPTDTFRAETENAVLAVPGARKRAARMALWAVLIVAAVGGAGYYFLTRSLESTDNAFIEGTVVQVSSRVPGQIVRIYVEDNQHVKKGELIAEIDPQDYQTRLNEARARLADVTARAEAAESNLALTSTVTGAVLTQAAAAVGAAGEQVAMARARLDQERAASQMAEAAMAQARAQLDAADAEAERAAADAVRYRALFAKDEVSRQQLERAETQARAAAASRTAARQAVEAARARLSQAKASEQTTAASIRQAETQVDQARGRVNEAKAGPQQVRTRQAEVAATRAGIEQARAAVAAAELALSYTRVVAPDSGYVTRKGAEPGNFVQPGQPLLALVSDRVWVVANFKETQLSRMRAGQKVSVKVDAYPQLKLRGHIESIQSGTGARFSLLPAENATGNYVKVVQRVPVKIALDEQPPAEYRIGPGMSVEPRVEVQ